jgi:hypothetical protein
MIGHLWRRGRTGPPGRPKASLALIGISLFALALAGCTPGAAGNGNGVVTLNSADPGASAAPSASMSPQDAALAFAQCMREHGIDMPDPQFDENGGKVQFGFSAGDKVGDKQKMEDAQEACQHFLDAASFGKGNAQLDPAEQDKILAFAKCMRDHGIDFPDPQFSDGGMVKVGGDNGPNFDPKSKEFQDAQQACQSLAPGGPDGGPQFQTNTDGGDGPSTSQDGTSSGTQP